MTPEFQSWEGLTPSEEHVQQPNGVAQRASGPAREINLSGGMMLYHGNAFTWSIEQCYTKAQEAGFCGIELHPTRRGMRELRSDPRHRRAIRSVHQSVRDERTILECLRAKNWKHRLQCFAVFEQRQDSFPELLSLQFGDDEGDDKRRVVFFADDSKAIELLRDSNCTALFQPCASLGKDWGVASADDLIAQMEVLGAKLCLDTHHWRGDFEGYRLPDWHETWLALLPHVKQLHVCAGRDDVLSLNRKEDTRRELRDLRGIGPATELRDMLTFLRSSGWKGAVVLEIPATSIIKELGTSPWVTPTKKVMEEFKIIRENIEEILST